MFNCLSAFFAILGTVIGSGFITGKEVVVFFSRFGFWSFPCIVLVFFLFFFILKALLFKGEQIENRLAKSKFAFSCNLFLCLVFSSAMFAGSVDMVKGYGKVVCIVFVMFLLLICLFISKKGMASLDKINLILVPLMTIVLVVGVVYLLKDLSFKTTSIDFAWASPIYAILYVVLNTSNSSVLIAKLGRRLTDKQKTRVAFYCSLVLCLILTMIDIVLISYPAVLGEEMPVLSLFSGAFRQVFVFAIMLGCVTTLFSLVFSLSSSMRGLCNNEFLIFFTSVAVPFVLSILGFGFILSYLYPIASVVGVFLLAHLTFIPFFKRTYKKIHSRSKQTK